MGISGSLETFSLPELFRLIDLGTKTGRLTIQPLPSFSDTQVIGTYYIWFHHGKLIAITNRLDEQGLINLIENRGWFSRRVIEKLGDLCPTEVPFGVFLKTAGVLKAEQLQLLFQLHLHQVYQLFEISSGWFVFEAPSTQKPQASKLTIPWLEMTGIKMRAMEATLLVLRLIKNWDGFADKLPESSSALLPLVRQPSFHLIAPERKIWESANGLTSLEVIASQTNQSSVNVKRAAFRLMMAGLVEEIAPARTNNGLVVQPPTVSRVSSVAAITAEKKTATATVSLKPLSEKREIGSSLLRNLVSFLRSRF
jgi:hypothetical protein